MGQAKLTDIPGIGPHTAQVLVDRGIETVDALATLPVEKLAAMPGFGPARAAAIAQALARLKQPSPGVEDTPNKPKKKDKKRKTKGKKDKKVKKDKKDKKKGKGRDEKKKKKKKKKGKKGRGKKRK